MANKTVQIRNIDNLISKVSLELSMEISRKDERAVRDAFERLADDIQEQFEKVDELDLSREPREAISQPMSIKKIIQKKTKQAKLKPAKKEVAVEPEVKI